MQGNHGRARRDDGFGGLSSRRDQRTVSSPLAKVRVHELGHLEHRDLVFVEHGEELVIGVDEPAVLLVLQLVCAGLIVIGFANAGLGARLRVALRWVSWRWSYSLKCAERAWGGSRAPEWAESYVRRLRFVGAHRRRCCSSALRRRPVKAT